ncbi:hypothetical protein QYF36_017086 [Acer negundo]|nr:hypothetical protein QYF36_017086 [Acer negundo]
MGNLAFLVYGYDGWPGSALRWISEG